MIALAVNLAFLGLALLALLLGYHALVKIPQLGSGPRNLLAHLFQNPFGPQTFGLANIAEGTHKGVITRFADAQVPCAADGGRLYFVAKQGVAANTAARAGVADNPIGIFRDSTDRGSFGGTTVTDLSIPLAIALFGSAQETGLVSLNSTVAQNDLLVPDATGYARTLPVASGTYWVFGRALQAGIAGDNIEFDPTLPYKVVVP